MYIYIYTYCEASNKAGHEIPVAWPRLDDVSLTGTPLKGPTYLILSRYDKMWVYQHFWRKQNTGNSPTIVPLLGCFHCGCCYSHCVISRPQRQGKKV